MNIKKSSKSGAGGFTRREFMTTAGAGTAALFSPFTLASSPSYPYLSPSDRPAAAVIGLGNRGHGMALWQLSAYADLLAVCDADRSRAERTANEFYQNTGRRVDIYQDYRRLLERKDIHLIGNATPEHWHTKITVDACHADKDVYMEKPMTLTIDEGKILSRVVKETRRIVQVGTQQRSGMQFQIAVSLIRGGRIGKLKQVAVIMPSTSVEHGGPCEEEPIPPDLNWDMWSGQAPLNPYCEARFRRPNRWWDYGGGLSTNWGAHHMDIAHWALGDEDIGPNTIEAKGYCPNLGKPGYPDQFHPLAAKMEYPGDVELWFMSTMPDVNNMDAGIRKTVQDIFQDVPEHIRNYNVQDPDGGILFIGDKGSFFVGRAGGSGEGFYELEDVPLAENGHTRWRSCEVLHTHDLVTCMNTRQQPLSHVAGQHKSQLPCHLTNIALRVGRKLQWDARRDEFIGDNEANAYLKREQREPYAIEG